MHEQIELDFEAVTYDDQPVEWKATTLPKPRRDARKALRFKVRLCNRWYRLRHQYLHGEDWFGVLSLGDWVPVNVILSPAQKEILEGYGDPRRL